MISSIHQLQQSLVDSFCSQIDYNEVITRKDLFKHLLYDDNYKVIYCFIPKSGCTKMKTLFVLLQGIFSLEDFFNKTVTHKNHLRKVKTLADLTAEERNAKLRDYYKFMIARDPLERFISGYRDKIKRSGVPKRFEKLQGDIIKDLRSRFSFFHKKRPSFSEFVQYFLRHTELFDDHFKPMLDICHPCYVKYHLYVDFSVLNYEMDKVLRLLGIPHYYYFNGVKHVESLMPKYYPTSFYVSYHFNQLNDELRQKILRKLRFDIQLYNNVTGRYY